MERANQQRVAKVLLLQFDTDPAAAQRRDLLSGLGATVEGAEPRWPVFFDTVTRVRPDIIIIACSRLTSYAREAARYLGEGFNTRDIPLVLTDVPEKERAEFEAYVLLYQPRARFADDSTLVDTLRALLSTPA